MPKNKPPHRPVARGPATPSPSPTQIQITVTGADLSARLGLDLPALNALLSDLEKERNSRLVSLVYIASDKIMLHATLLSPLEQVLTNLGKVSQLDLFLRSTGGVTEIPWRVISLLREFGERLGVIVSKFAFSGACHIAIAADDLVMTPFAVLGSVDPTRNHALLPKDDEGKPIPTSVQDLKHLIQFLREQLGESYATQNLALIMSELFKYINPLAIGALEQSFHLARLITKKALKTHNKPLDDDQIDKIVEILSGQYFSHSFPISRTDVENDLKLPLTKAEGALSAKIKALDDLYDLQFQKSGLIAPGTREPLVRPAAFLHTTGDAFMLMELHNEKGEHLGQSWLKLS